MTDNMIKYTLKSPVKGADEKDVTELTFREPTVGDMIAIEQEGGGDLERTFRLLSLISGQPFDTFKAISHRDIAGIMDATDGLVGNGEADGATSPS